MGQSEFQYQRLAGHLEGQIRDGGLAPGQKLPSMRALQRRLGLSMATVGQALAELEVKGLVESRPRSGYYVREGALEPAPPPRPGRAAAQPAPVPLQSFTASVIQASLDPKLAPFGASTLDPGVLTGKHLARLTRAVLGRDLSGLLQYAPPEGEPALRRLVAGRLMGLWPQADPERVVITNGCMEAVSLALLALTRPGQVVATESPTHFGFLQLLRELDRLVVEVPTDPRLGVDPEGLRRVLEQNPVAACLFIPNFQNPTGAAMPPERKARVMAVATAFGVPVIEDDVYGELYFGQRRPDLLASHDPQGLVVSCGSFSKVLSPGFRVGWAAARTDLAQRLGRLKAGLSMAAPSLEQKVLVEFLASGALDRYLRSLRGQVRRQVFAFLRAARRLFPPACRLSEPEGGNLLWLELPPGVSALEVYQRALAAGISLVPGPAFSAGGGYAHHLRLCCTRPLDEGLEEALARLGVIIAELAG